MEAGLILRLECTDTDQCDFVYLMLDNAADRPMDEDEVSSEYRDAFSALEDIEIPEYVGKHGDTTIEATWTLGGADIEGDVEEILKCLKKCQVQDAFAILAGDEGWFELWILNQGKISSDDEWNGESLEDLIYADEDDDEYESDDDDDEEYEEGDDEFFVLLNRIREQALSSK